MYKKECMRVIADAWAASMDAMVGIAIVGFVFGTNAHWWYFPQGSVLALLPDMLYLPWLWAVLRGKPVLYDHHMNWSHRPLLVMPVATALSWYFEGPQWAFAAGACLGWHFLHDYPFGDGYINWLWPFTRDRTVAVDHDQWRNEHWLRRSRKFDLEIGIGGMLMAAGLFYAGQRPLMLAALCVLTAAVTAWTHLTIRYGNLPYEAEA